MSSSIHFRFKSAKEFETLSFEGDFLKVADLKVAIVARKKLNFGEGFDLEISDASTSDVFHDENSLVQKNTSVIVRRIPGLKQGGILSQQEMASKNERYAEKGNSRSFNGSKSDGHAEPPTNSVLKTIEGDDEAARIASLVMQSTAYDQYPQQPRGRYQRGGYRGRGFSGHGHRKSYPDRAPRPSHNYICHRCNKAGHWIDECPTNGDPKFDKIKVRAPTGIPRSMLRQVDAPESGTGLQDSSGHFVTLQPNEEEFARQTVGLRLSQAAAAASEKPSNEGGDGKKAPEAETPTVLAVEPPASMPDEQKKPEVPKGKNEKEVAEDSDTRRDPSSKSIEKVDDVTKDNQNSSSNLPNGAGRQNGKHEGRSGGGKGHGRRGPNIIPPHMNMQGLPLPPMPHGFPPMGVPPFPPPPEVLIAMAAMAGNQNRVPPMPPGMIPGMPFPFPGMPSGNGPDVAVDGSNMAGYTFPPAVSHVPHGNDQRGAEADLPPGEKPNGKLPDKSSEDKSQSPVEVSRLSKERGNGESGERANSDRSGRRSSRVPDDGSSKSHSVSSRDRPKANSAEREHRRHDRSYENETAPPRDPRGPRILQRPLHSRPNSRPLTPSVSPRERPRSPPVSTPEKRRARDPSPGARDELQFRRRHGSSDRREHTRSRRTRSPRGRSPERERIRSRNTPSPVRDRRGGRTAVSPPRESRRSRSPGGRHRYDSDRYRSGRWRSRNPGLPNSRRSGDRLESGRGRSRSPLLSRYGSRRGSPEPPKSRTIPSRIGYPPSPDIGRWDTLDRESTRRRSSHEYDGYRAEERDSKRRRTSKEEDYGRNGDGLPARKEEPRSDPKEKRRALDQNRGEARDRSPGLRRKDERPKRGREGVNGDGRGDLKRSRRDSSPERSSTRREDRRDRLSVHDRLGRPLGDRKRSRRSVHDRLG